MKLRIDSERRPRELDPVLGIQVPAFVPTLRTLTEQFPNSPVTQPAFLRLADAYEDLAAVRARRAGARAISRRTSRRNAGEAWFRAGEIYERRLKDADKAREAFDQRARRLAEYRDAQRKLRRTLGPHLVISRSHDPVI